MDKLFGNNTFFIYLFACITIFNFTKFQENQKIFLIYLFTFGLSFTHLLSVSRALLFLLCITFIYLEFLTDDEEKLHLLIKIKYKLLDYIFLVIFQYGILWIVLSIIFTSIRLRLFIGNYSILDDINLFISTNLVMNILSLIFFIFGTIHVSSQKFQVKRFTELISYFSAPSINHVSFNKLNQNFYSILSDIEDKSYFHRKKSYNFCSLEFIKYKLKKFNITRKNKFVLKNIKYYALHSKHIRGYSTLEMQLIRTIGIERGYNKKYIRKIYELVYSTIFFKSLLSFYNDNIYSNRKYFKEYLIYIYLQNVNTKIAGTYFRNLSKVFSDDLVQWSEEQFLVVCAGLSHAKFSSDTIIDKHLTLILNYNLDQEEIRKIVEEIENKDLQTLKSAI